MLQFTNVTMSGSGQLPPKTARRGGGTIKTKQIREFAKPLDRHQLRSLLLVLQNPEKQAEFKSRLNQESLDWFNGFTSKEIESIKDILSQECNTKFNEWENEWKNRIGCMNREDTIEAIEAIETIKKENLTITEDHLFMLECLQGRLEKLNESKPILQYRGV